MNDLNGAVALSGPNFLLATAALIALIVTGWTCWRYRRQFWRPVLSVAVLLVFLFLLANLTGRTASVILESAAARLFAVYCLFIIVWVVFALVCPRIPNRDRAFAPLLLGIPLAFGFLAAGISLWRAADDGLQISMIPVVHSEAEALALWNGPSAARLYGALAEGAIGDVDVARDRYNAGLTERLWYDNETIISSSGNRHTGPFTIRLEDGSDLDVAAPIGTRIAWNWPQSRRHAFRNALQDSDPVVIWTDVLKLRSLKDGTVSAGFIAPRVVAYGTLEGFRKSFVPRAIFSGQLIAACALAMIPAALLTLFATLLWWRRIKINGSDEKSAPITITVADGQRVAAGSIKRRPGNKSPPDAKG